ncbi:MAG: LipL32 family surface lipoprotein [Bacteroidota bacterium]|nr:LipL32 family surface lipoprotein [Bacteroidota bacterium]
MKKLLSSLVITTAFLSLTAFVGGDDTLDKFKADMGKKSVMGKEVRVPYTDVLSYYGYVKPGATPDETRDGKKYYYLYIWVPAVAPELGIRMASPVPSKMSPDKADFVSPDYTANSTDTKNYFDTWITLERADGVTSIADIATKGKTAKWNSYGSNDDSGEMPAQPSGSKYNSLMRITSETSNPTKSLVVGLYRVGFTTYKTGEVQGSFIAQVGAPVKLPGVGMAKTIDELSTQMTKK